MLVYRKARALDLFYSSFTSMILRAVEIQTYPCMLMTRALTINQITHEFGVVEGIAGMKGVSEDLSNFAMNALRGVSPIIRSDAILTRKELRQSINQ